MWLKGTGPYKFGVFAIIDGDVYGDDDQDYEDGDEMIIIESNQLIKVEELLVSPQSELTNKLVRFVKISTLFINKFITSLPRPW